MKAKEIMTRNVKTVKLDTTVEEIVKVLALSHISGVPVVDDDDRVLGIVTEHDLLLRDKIKQAVPRMALFGLFVVPEEEVQKAYRGYCNVHASEIMKKNVISFPEDADINEIAKFMHKHKINRVPITDNGKLTGIISRADIIRSIVGGAAGNSCEVG